MENHGDNLKSDSDNHSMKDDRRVWLLFLFYLLSWPLILVFFRFLFYPAILLAIAIITIVLFFLAVRSYIRDSR